MFETTNGVGMTFFFNEMENIQMFETTNQMLFVKKITCNHGIL
jgi:hypothetical protein